MLIQATQLRVGMIFQEGKNLYRLTYVHHVTPGNLRGFVQTKFKDIRTGIQYERKFSSEDRIDKATLDYRQMEYLYEDRGEFHFMDTGSHEQISLLRDVVGDLDKFLASNQNVDIAFFEGKPLSVELPASVALRVVETVPGMKHATATGSSKPATLETGLVVQVPQFVNEGDSVRVDTSTGEYLERVKK